MNSIAIFKHFPKTKSEITAAVTNIKGEILSGNHNPLELDLYLKKMEEVIKGVRDDKEVKAVVLSELEKYTEKTVEFANCQISKVSRGTYDYDLCADPELTDLEREALRVKEALTDRQKFLQALKNELTIVTPDGEIRTIYPANKKSTETYSIKIL